MEQEIERVNIYDFDGTICYKDCTIGFWKFCIKKNPFILFCLPIQIFGILLFKLKITKGISFFYIYLLFLKNKEKIVNDFCDIHEKYICDWYKKQRHDNDIIVSASPSFIIKEMARRLNVRCVASDVNLKNGVYNKPSCQEKQKVIQLKEKYPNIIVEKSYGNSKQDKYIISIAKNGYMVKNYSEKAVFIQEMTSSVQ